MKTTGNEIKKLLKANGIDTKKVRATVDATAARVSLSSLEIDADKVSGLLSHLESISRCEATGEILSGGNFFVFVSYGSDVEIPQKIVDELLKIEIRFAGHEGPTHRAVIFANVLAEKTGISERQAAVAVSELLFKNAEFAAKVSGK